MDTPWLGLRKWFSSLRELDLMTMRFANVWSLLELVGPQLESLTLELDDEQVGSLTHFLLTIVLFPLKTPKVFNWTMPKRGFG